ncbi:hypothetical protein P280DRAFT_387178 [Massarina eburnea CBS 473.64]|uniref:2EXR domain-containing protein n=1 Tax=Massarina eburnea CBS 473.64 TaxID=1395130 RepID=A0A6A6SIL9_9PLEO|nr:hypothetical protein P280DRAFT_387178 [Massarina eburnea CBS 473.64]
MANVQSTPATVVAIRFPKRKRVAVNYYEEDMDSDDAQKDVYHEELKASKTRKRKTTTPKTLKVFPFLQLPAEIRNQIYSLCLVDPVGIYLCATTKKVRRTVRRVPESNYLDFANNVPNKIAPLVPALLATNKQIYEEARTMLYDNDFYMGDTLTMHSFLVDIGARAAALLKRVALISWGGGRGVNKAYNHASFTALSTATNLENFIIYRTLGYRSDPKGVATNFYRDAFPWLEAYGTAKGKVDAAVDTVQISGSNLCLTRRHRERWPREMTSGTYDKMDEFREELSKLLSDRMDMIRR